MVLIKRYERGKGVERGIYRDIRWVFVVDVTSWERYEKHCTPHIANLLGQNKRKSVFTSVGLTKISGFCFVPEIALGCSEISATGPRN